MPVYLLSEVEITDRAGYVDYSRRLIPIVVSFGGEYLFRTESITPVEGDWMPQRILLIRFPDKTALLRCFSCEDYLALKPLRDATSQSKTLVITPGLLSE